MMLQAPLLWVSIVLPIAIGIIAWPIRSKAGLHALFYLSSASLLIPLVVVLYGYASGVLEGEQRR